MRVGIVGCGRISKRHIEAIDSVKGLDLAAVCDIDETKTHDKLLNGRELSRYTDYRKITDVDIISVCTPSGNHPFHAAEVAEYTSVPFIVIEKPIALTVREAVELYRKIQKTGKHLLPVYQNRYNPLVQFVHDLIKKGSLGIIYQYTVNIFWNRNDDYYNIDWHGTQDLDGGVLYTQASHYVDMILFLFGPVSQAKGLGGRLRGLSVQDTISAVVQHKNMAVGSLNCTVNTYNKNYQTELTIIGSKGTVNLKGTNLNTIDFWDVEGLDKPNMDFALDHIYGKGHDFLYQYIYENKWEMFPSKEEVLSGIELMERLSF